MLYISRLLGLIGCFESFDIRVFGYGCLFSLGYLFDSESRGAFENHPAPDSFDGYLYLVGNFCGSGFVAGGLLRFSLSLLILPFLMLLANFLNYPVEQAIRIFYLRKAQRN